MTKTQLCEVYKYQVFGFRNEQNKAREDLRMRLTLLVVEVVNRNSKRRIAKFINIKCLVLETSVGRLDKLWDELDRLVNEVHNEVS